MWRGAVGGLLLACALAPHVTARADGPAIVISEFISNPTLEGNDGAEEWVELHNPGSEPVDLAGWRIEDGAGGDTIDSLVVPPNGHAVIAGRSVQFTATVPVFRPKDGTIGGGLNNGGDVIRLVDPGGVTIDQLTFGSGSDIPAPGEGRSLGRNEAGDWRLTIEPTPGGPNAFIDPATFATQFPVPIEYRIADDGMKQEAWLFLGACAGAGITGAALLLHRSRKRRETHGR